MKVVVSGKNQQVRDDLKDVIEEKLQKFEKYFNSSIEAHATLTHRKDKQIVEVTIPLKNGVIFRAEDTDYDVNVCIDRVIDRLSKQMKKHKTKLEKRYHAHDTIRFESIPDNKEELIAQSIVKTKKFAVKPMDPEEAVLQMEMLGHDFFVFRNSDSEEVNVVYHRKDGQYGIIEPIL